MITAEDIQAAIAECEGTRRPNANTCLKLAALYTIRDNMQPQKREQQHAGYSFASPPQDQKTDEKATVHYRSETEFGRIVTGKDTDAVFSVVDELLTALQGMIPRLYAGVMGKLQDL